MEDAGPAGDFAIPEPAASCADIVIRPSSDADLAAMVAIYEHHIRRGVGDVGDFEEDRLLPDDLRRRRKTMRKKRLPHLVADRNGQVAGYAYAVPFRKRPAYRYTLKHSIYVHPEHLHAGIGRRLLPALIEACAAGGYRQMIGYIDSENAASLRLHEACGFVRVGHLPAVGYKYGRWSDSVMVQCALGSGSDDQPSTWRKPVEALVAGHDWTGK
ncbi:N-acetyltransferase [Methylobacterium sp. WL30]|jgi:phosphinothricin acetyltransferase|uniref:GNAT family N-acetyltransferase n=1 Tax=unclassified Methylobacterium TaxID=2615210 RepID=UPI0011CC8AA9|nr:MULTISPECIES: GNAT family N-acetyltransferase [unclassified Methylobacterium]MCJ2006324.1 GNAT family N-acetyltransferase [Methylobacterium sp. J-092]MCJ2040748.1 GNAT family N-acetyltransferase [Methylobacterium sp. J-059]MCJ2078352.1 GNAT family N-acetyltransferase [Methylobacterium sp. E-016]MCJ2109838.1 GNAT family N-acetyltransferase [Methylobacterium sp. E-025]TXM94118.1 N-acetyltransferase [Methylobacterium sp. WL116]